MWRSQKKMLFRKMGAGKSGCTLDVYFEEICGYVECLFYIRKYDIL